MYLISRCLLGDRCKYNGGHNRSEAVLQFAAGHTVIGICPETAGGLQAPREPAEWQGDRCRDRAGKDLTEAFVRGAESELARAEEAARQAGETLEGAILKANSPSCGAGMIYDGTFSGTKVPGDGCFTRLLRAKGVPVCTEKDLTAEGEEQES